MRMNVIKHIIAVICTLLIISITIYASYRVLHPEMETIGAIGQQIRSIR